MSRDRIEGRAQETILRLRTALAGELPGRRAYKEAFPGGFGTRSLPEGVAADRAAVLLVLHPDPLGDRFQIPLIVRTESMFHHAGQVGLPGGAVDDGEGVHQAALREAFEEIGLDPQKVQILGELSPITIPISRFEVHTVVGYSPAPIVYLPHDREVMRVILADPDHLADEGPSSWIDRVGHGGTSRHPAYAVEGEAVWGATALILSEFLHLWRQMGGPPSRPSEGES